MLVLLDQGVPAPLRSYLKEHTVKTAAQQAWATLNNGELLKVAEAAGFHVMVTADKNLAYQQNLKDRAIAIVVLGSPRWPLLKLHADLVAAAVTAATPGSYSVVEVPID
jgi:hypothetical protein